MKKIRQRIAVLLACVMTFSSVLSGYAASWQSVGGIWYYNRDDGSHAAGWLKILPQEWYYLNDSGQMQIGWYQDTDGSRYYLSTAAQGVEGQMKYGWYQDSDGTWYFLNTVHDGTFGHALNAGWQWIDGYCYYFGTDGKMAAGGMTPDGYTVNADGQWTENGVAQYVPGKGIITKQTPASGGSQRSSGSSSGSGGSSSSGNSTGGSGSGSGSSTGGNSGSGTGGNTGGADDKYKVYEESNKDTFETDAHVKAFANETQEDKQELKSVADSLVDYWTEADDLGTTTENQGGSDTVFQSVSKLNLVVLEDSPLYKGILAGDISEGDVIVIPSCEYFPAGMSIVYLDNDDAYAGEALSGMYDSNRYQVLHTTEATFSDIFTEEMEYHAGGVNSSDPVQFIWTPTLAGNELREIMLWQPRAIAAATPPEADRNDAVSEATSSNAASPEVSLMSGEYPIMPIAGNNKSELFSFSQTAGDEGINLLFKADKVVLYDGDGDYDTKNDQIILDGKIGLENINPEFGFLWEPNFSDPMPKQLKAIVKYDQVVGLTVSAEDSVKVNDFTEKMREALDLPENKQTYLGLEMQGVDMDNTIVLACVGVNLGLNKVMTKMKDIQYNTKSIFAGLEPMIVFMILMDVDGNISVKTTLDAQYRDENKVGINVQRQGFNGSLGTQAENKGDFNTDLMGYDINIFNHHDTTLELSVKTEGSAELDTSVGIGAGIMCLGIMPAMVKGNLGLDSKLEGSGEISWDNKEGMNWKVEGEASMRAYLKARALVKLKCKADWWLLKVDTGIDKDFDLMDITLLEEKWSQTAEPEQGLRYDNSWEKYLDYTEEQLAKEFHEFSYDYEVPNTSHRSKEYIYYDGIEELPLVKNTYTMYGTDRVEYHVKYDETDPSNQFVIERSVYGDWDGNQWIERRYTKIHMRVKNMIIGITDTTTLNDLSSIGAVSVAYDFNLSSYDIYFAPEDMSDEYFEVDIDVLKNLDYKALGQIVREETSPYLGLSKRLTDYCKDKLLNPEAYAELH